VMGDLWIAAVLRDGRVIRGSPLTQRPGEDARILPGSSPVWEYTDQGGNLAQYIDFSVDGTRDRHGSWLRDVPDLILLVIPAGRAVIDIPYRAGFASGFASADGLTQKDDLRVKVIIDPDIEG
jgi:hypothetical protein